MVAGLVVLMGLSILVDAAVYSDKIHAGVTIAGRGMSGLTREEAATALANHIDEAQGRSVNLISDEKTWEVSPDSLGLKIDTAGAVSAAMSVTRDSNIFGDLVRKLRLYFSGHDIPLEGTVDEASLDALLDQVAAEIDVPAVNASVAIEGSTITEIPSEEGLIVDRETLREHLTLALFSLNSVDMLVPIIVHKPEIRAEDNAAALAQMRTMVSAPLILTSGDRSWTFPGRRVASFIDFRLETDDGVSKWVPYLSAEKMTIALELLKTHMETPPVDAHFEGDDEKAWVVPAVPGTELDLEATVSALNAAALKTTDRTAEAVFKPAYAELSTEDAEAMGIKDLLSVRTTVWTGSTNRQNNVRITTEYIHQDGRCYLAPGEEFSFHETVGERIPERGYKPAPGITKHGELKPVYGGGICQVATTLFNSVFFAGLEVTERSNHSIYISHYPEGRDAAVAGDEVDLKFINDTDHYIWIKGESSGVRTTFWIYGTSDGRTVSYRNSGIYGKGPAPRTYTRFDPTLPPGTTVVDSPGQSYMKVLVTRWTTWPDGTVKEDKFLSKFPERLRIIRVGPTPST